MAGKLVGIDLGTTFSAIATLDERGRPVTLPNRDGEMLTPSAVLLADGEAVVQGSAASLREALTSHVATNERLKAAFDRLEQCERRFLAETPFSFYAWLLGGDNGRARILRRLGHEANDALDEFLELALAYARKAPASL